MKLRGRQNSGKREREDSLANQVTGIMPAPDVNRSDSQGNISVTDMNPDKESLRYSSLESQKILKQN